MNINIFQIIFKHQKNNIFCEYDQILYKNEIDSKETSTINSTVINNEYLYFIVINNKNNMFGHYFETIIHNSYKHNEYNYNYYFRIFIFSLINK